MLRRIKKQHGFSLVEAIIAAVIFAIATAGIFSTLIVLRKPAAESDERIGAAYFAQQILEDLRAYVSANGWDTGPLSVGVHSGSGPITLTGSGPYGVLYTAQYTVTQDANGARKVQVSVTW